MKGVIKLESKLEIAKKILEENNQEHLLSQYEKLSDDKKEYLLNQILNINFEEIQELFNNIKKEIKFENDKIEPIKYIEKNKLTDEEKNKYFEIGANEIKNNKLAVVTMAGRSRNKTWTRWTKRDIHFRCYAKS